MLIQGIDGELRIYDKGYRYNAEGGETTHYLQVLFCEMDFSAPTTRPRTEERLIMNRGTFDTVAHYAEGPDDPRYAPIPITFSARLADTVDSRALSDLLSGASIGLANAAGGASRFVSWDGTTTVDGNTLPSFRDSSKYAYRVELLYDTAGSDLGYRYEEVHFPPGQQTISESPDGLMISGSGTCYGDVTRITAFYSGTSIIAFT